MLIDFRSVYGLRSFKSINQELAIPISTRGYAKCIITMCHTYLFRVQEGKRYIDLGSNKRLGKGLAIDLKLSWFMININIIY